MLGEWWTAFLVGVAVLAFIAGLSDPHREPAASERRRIAETQQAKGLRPDLDPPRDRPPSTGGRFLGKAAARRRARGAVSSGATRGGEAASRSTVTRRAALRARGLPVLRRT